MKEYYSFSVVTSTGGTSSTAYGFTGETTDANGLVYLRARYYSSSGAGRFLSRDTWGGDVMSPPSLNRWMYVEGNPVNLVDPSGNYPSEFAEFRSGDGAGQFEEIDEALIHVALDIIASAYLRAYNGMLHSLQEICNDPIYLTPAYQLNKTQIFYRIHRGKVTFSKFDKDPGYYGEAAGENSIYIYKGGSVTNSETYRYLSGYTGEWPPSSNDGTWVMVQQKYHRFITHEMGHAFDSAIRNHAPSRMVGIASRYLPKPESPYQLGGFCGTKSDGWQWRLDNQRAFQNEIFADMYLSWTYGCLTSPQRSDYMGEMMPTWIFYKAQPFHNIYSGSSLNEK